MDFRIKKKKKLKVVQKTYCKMRTKGVTVYGDLNSEKLEE